MLPEQGTGGPVERPRRQLSTSAPCPNSEGEPMQESKVQIQQQPQDEKTKQKTTQSSQESPRRCQVEPRAATPGASVMSRNPSDASAASPPPETSSSGRSSPGSSHVLPVEPPVTRATLSELDVSKIVHNPKLRHDINFDPELHFRPNLDGEKGRKKQDKANQFWRALKKELTEFITDRPTFYANHGESDNWTLPALLKAVKEIIQTLVPQRDRQFLEEGLNVELLMQQFHKGIADLEKLALWLSRVLKSHCAPMRDDWVDTMYAQLSNGNRNMDLDELVTGMRSLLSVLEAMKLDVANHQIRCLRPVLIEDTTHFEQKFFYKKMETGKMMRADLEMSKQWYKDAEERYTCSVGHTSQSFGDMGVFFEALTRLILPSAGDKRIPNTFAFDDERLMKLRSDITDAINLELCMRMYEDLERMERYNWAGLLPTYEWGGMETFDFNTPPSTSRPSSLVFSSAGSANSSPRSSFVLPTTPIAPTQTDSRARARDVYNSLVALLQSSPPSNRRWQMMAGSMALQIFRFTNAPSDILPVFEAKLAANLLNVNSAYYQDVVRSFHDRLMLELGNRVREFRSLSGLALFSVATGGRFHGSHHSGRDRDVDTSVREYYDDGSIEDAATRLAHLGVLHWRVWSQLVYLRELDNLPEEDDEPMQI